MEFFSKTDLDILKLVSLFKKGQVVAGPTETAYGLLADATNQAALKKIFYIKGRPAHKPCPVVVATLAMAKKWADFDSLSLKLAQAFWPGPLTLVLPTQQSFWPARLLAGQAEIGLRLTSSSWLRKLSGSLGRPVTATSANLSGQPVLYDYKEVAKQLAPNNLKYLVASRRLPIRPVSTVVRVRKGHLRVLRRGAISLARIEDVIRYK
ncbi:threonylcarbamoyl-AMP synthase [Patescibacteria group bacterium]|nr:threonylcarbamoyl-AMP synthase [Patescibacteria group bacterium]